MIFLHACACLPVFLSITGSPALSTLGWQTSLSVPPAYAGDKMDSVAASTSSVRCFLLASYSIGSSAGGGAFLPPKPVVIEVFIGSIFGDETCTGGGAI